MARSKRLIPFLLTLVFAAILVRGGHRVRNKVLRELGLTPPCVKRVVATCHVSPVEIKTDRESFVKMVEKIAETEQCITEIKNDLHSLNRLEQKSKKQEKTLSEMIQSLNKLEQKSEKQENALSEIKDQLQSLNKLEQRSIGQEKAFSEIKANLQSLNRLEQKSKEQENALSDITANLQSLNKLEQKISKMKENEDRNHAQITFLVEIVTNLQNRLFPPRNCAELQTQGDRGSGVRTVYPYTCCKDKVVTVFCDQTTDGGGWTVFQRRDALPHREDFFRGWYDYQIGFGNVTGEFWLGLDNIHALISDTPNELYVTLEDFEGDKRWAKYDTFSIEDADGKYRLHVGGYSGNAGNSLNSHDGHMFSTKDQNNDIYTSKNCAEKLRGAWWFLNCLNSHLNGFQLEGKHESAEEGINWYHFKGDYYSLKKSEMKIRPKV